MTSHAYVYGLMCGNCDQTFTSTNWARVAWLYAVHMRDVHTGWHQPERLEAAP